MKQKSRAKASTATTGGAKAPTATSTRVAVGISSRGSACSRASSGRLADSTWVRSEGERDGGAGGIPPSSHPACAPALLALDRSWRCDAATAWTGPAVVRPAYPDLVIVLN